MGNPQPDKVDFNPAISIVIECDQQSEIDFYWEKLGEQGHYSMCGWLQDKFGFSWQIVPSKLAARMKDPVKAPLVTQKFMNMQKFDLSQLELLF